MTTSRREVSLGRAAISDFGTGLAAEPESLEDRVLLLEHKVDMLSQILNINNIRETVEEVTNLHNDDQANLNSDGIPIGMNLLSSSKGQVFVLTVTEDAYYIGNRPFKSLSAAAGTIRGSRVNGWEFWRLADGTTAKEAFGK